MWRISYFQIIQAGHIWSLFKIKASFTDSLKHVAKGAELNFRQGRAQSIMQKQGISASANKWISEKQNSFWATSTGRASILQLHPIVHPFSSWNSCDITAQVFLSFFVTFSILYACIFDGLTLSCFFCFLLTLCTCSAAFHSSVLILCTDSLADGTLWKHLQEEWFSM